MYTIYELTKKEVDLGQFNSIDASHVPKQLFWCFLANFIMKLLKVCVNTVSVKAEYNILLAKLDNWVGLSGTAVIWFGSYFVERDYFASTCK